MRECSSDTIRIAHVVDHCTNLGPGSRAGVWVQGCPFRCEGCTSPEKQGLQGGQEMAIDVLADHIVLIPDIEGVTFSGGEPFIQASGLVRLIDTVKARRGLSMMAYSGYTLDFLRCQGSAAQQHLLGRLDILIDGPYVQRRATRKLWRGSENQQVHFLTNRYSYLSDSVDRESAQIEIQVGRDGSVLWIGIPPPGFREAFEQGMASKLIRWRCLR